MLVHTLGTGRLSTHTATLDARLRIKQSLPNSPTEDDLRYLAAQRPANTATPSAHDILTDLMKPKGGSIKLLSKQLHSANAIDNDSFWTEVLAREFEEADDSMLMGVDVEENLPCEPSLAEMIHLLECGLPDTEEIEQVVPHPFFFTKDS